MPDPTRVAIVARLREMVTEAGDRGQYISHTADDIAAMPLPADPRDAARLMENQGGDNGGNVSV